MEHTLKVTNVFSDPTRFNIYQFLLKQKNNPVTVLDIAEQFNIHPNVARIHLAKLEDINIVSSDYERTGKGGRPSRIYQMTDHVIELNFPHRDYKLLSTVALDTLSEMGEIGKQALYEMGQKYGEQTMKKLNGQLVKKDELTIKQKINLLEHTSIILGMYPKFTYIENKQQIKFEINNCPFKEVAKKHQTTVCHMHYSFIKGMFEAVFETFELIEQENMFAGCANCKYVANLSIG